MVQCTYPDQKVCTSSISYGSFEEGFDHVAVDFFPTFDEQLEFLGFSLTKSFVSEGSLAKS